MRVPMRMAVWLARRIVRLVRVVMMLVMNVQMRVLQLVMHVLVRMSLGEMQPHAGHHARTSGPE